MKIELVLHRDHVEVIFINTSSADLHLWHLGNPKGWFSVSFEVKNAQGTNVSTIYHLWNMEFSGPGSSPSAFVLAPGEKRGFPVNLIHWEWMRDGKLSYFADKPLLIRANYHSNTDNLEHYLIDIGTVINPDQSSAARWNAQIANLQANVFVGFGASEWVASEPPHEWLFGERTIWAKNVEQLLQYPPEEVLRRISQDVDYLAWWIELNANAINEKSAATSQEVAISSGGMTIGHFATAILEYALEIQKALKEANKYLEAKASPKTGNGADTPPPS
jgi:hypothetical protein